MNSLEYLSKYRTELMGFATIWVMLFHFKANMFIAPLNSFSSIGYGGVDIFLFLSGFGLFFGYEKHKSLGQFYYRRFIRIYPLYFFVIILCSLLADEYNMINILLKSTGLGYYLPFIPNASYEWYVPTIILFYLLFPILHKLLKVNVKKYGFLFICIGLTITAILIALQRGTIILTTSRIPIFILGCMAGYSYLSGIIIKKTFVICTISLLFMAFEVILVDCFDNIFLWRNALYWLPFIIITPGLCFTLCYLFDKFNSKIVLNMLYHIGCLSFEMYLIHVICLGYYRDWCLEFIANNVYKLWFSFILFSLIVWGLSFVLHKIFNVLIYERTSKKY